MYGNGLEEFGVFVVAWGVSMDRTTVMLTDQILKWVCLALKHRGLTQSQCGVIFYEICQRCFMKGLQVLYDFLNQYKVGDGKLH